MIEPRLNLQLGLPSALPKDGEIEDLRRRLSEVEKLLEISGEIGRTLDLDRLLDLALVRAEEVCHAETSSIWELDEERQELFFRVVRGKAAPGIRGLRVPVGEGIVGAVAASGQPEIVNDVSSDSRWRGEPLQGFETRSLLTVPLGVQRRVVGVMQLLNPVDAEGFTLGDLWRMNVFAGPLAQAIDNARLFAERKRQFFDTVTALAEATELRDPYTGGHSNRVTAYSLLLGSELGLGVTELEELMLTATLHDVGKLATPDSILRKPAPLSTQEKEVMRRHPADGAEMLAKIHGLRHVVPAVRAHHEHIDGGGYPDGLRDQEIPYSARILAVADAFDAMVTERPYRQGLAPVEAARRIVSGAGTQFWEPAVEAFDQLFDGDRWVLDHGRRLGRGFLGLSTGREL
ncbi:MAG: HD domain-containing phosphohydrolase [Acidobacteriota bacterium]